MFVKKSLKPLAVKSAKLARLRPPLERCNVPLPNGTKCPRMIDPAGMYRHKMTHTPGGAPFLGNKEKGSVKQPKGVYKKALAKKVSPLVQTKPEPEKPKTVYPMAEVLTYTVKLTVCPDCGCRIAIETVEES